MNTNTFDWLDTEAYPFAAQYLDLDGQRLHYIDEGQGEVWIFVHGTPSWSFDFRHSIKTLSQRYRCIALDHLGFGLSDKPKDGDYSVQAHSRRLERLIEHLGLTRFTLVLHDFGGVIGMDYALRNPDKIERLVLLNTWCWDCSEEPEYRKLRRILKSPLLPVLYRWFNFSARFLVPASFGDKKKLSKAIHRHYLAPFANRHQREGTVAFARSLLHDQAWFETLWQQRERLASKPALLIWGMADSFILPKYLDKWLTAFPQAKVVKLNGVGHFPQEEAAEEVAQAMLDF